MGNLAKLAWLVIVSVTAFAQSNRWVSNLACVELCEKITSCATKVERPELSRTLCHIAACESGRLCGRKQVRSPNGLYHGPFQFGRKTWSTICQPVFKEKAVSGCSEKGSIYDTCCNSICAAEIIATKRNRGIRNWPRCGPQAERAVAAENKTPAE